MKYPTNDWGVKILTKGRDSDDDFNIVIDNLSWPKRNGVSGFNMKRRN